MNYVFTGAETAVAALVVALVLWLVKLVNRHAKSHEEIPKRLERIEAEFRPNGGYSQHDRMEALYELMVQIATKNDVKVARRPPREP